MQIGAGRPLCCFCWLLAAGVAFSFFAPVPVGAVVLTAAVIAVAVFVFCLLAVWNKKRRYGLRQTAFVLLGALLGIVATLLYQSVALRPAYDYAKDSQGEAIEVCGLVVSCEVESSYISAYGLQLDLPNGKSCRTYLSLQGEDVLSVGDEVRISATLCPVEQMREQEWMIRYLRGEGYVLYAEAQSLSSDAVVSRGQFVLREHLATLQRQLSDRLSRAVGGEQGRLVAALLLGTREQLSDATVLDFRRAGASHLLALSGLHLSIIVLLLGALLRLLKCPYRLRIVLLCSVAVLFLLLTGCGISTLRATVMLLFLSVSRLRGAPHDALTPLSLFFAACLLARPTWILDVGLWLTVLATLCMVEMVPALVYRVGGEKKTGVLSRVWRYAIASLTASSLVLLVVLLPMALFFGEFSWLSPLANLALTPLATLVLALGLVLLPLLYVGRAEAVCDGLCDLLHGLGDAMLRLSARLSDVKGALISLRYDFVPYLIGLLLLILLVLLFFRWKHPRRVALLLVVWCVLFGACLGITRWHRAGHWQATYTVHGNSELLTLNEDSTTVLCDMGDGSYSVYNAWLNGGLPDGTTEIDALVLTHYHQRHISTIYKLLGDCRVRKIYLPLTMPYATQQKAQQDEGILRSILTTARERRVEVCFYEPHSGAEVAERLSLERLHYDMLGRSTHPVLAVTWRYCHRDAAYEASLCQLGRSVWESEAWEEACLDAASSDVLLLGGHGPIIKSSFGISDWIRAPKTVLLGPSTTALEPDAATTNVLAGATLYPLTKEHTKFPLP